MATKKQLKKVAAKFNATIEKGDYDRYYHCWTVEVFAPDSHEWVDGSGSSLIVYIWNCEKNSASKAYDDLIERMELGLEDLTQYE